MRSTGGTVSGAQADLPGRVLACTGIVLVASALTIGEAAEAAVVRVTFDAADVHQAFYGLGGGMAVFVDQNGNDVLTASQRSRVIDALAKQIKITTGYLRPLFEGENAAV